jgi:hypothetical protein
MRSAKTKTQKMSKIKKVLPVILIFIGLFSFSNNGYGANERELASTAFPRIKVAYDTDDILEDYQPYLNFVVDIGKQADPASTQKLIKSFSELQKRNPESAARFLKGLRFEMLEKAERLGRVEARISSSSTEMRKWVNRFMKDWAREADEHLFRVNSSQLARK